MGLDEAMVLAGLAAAFAAVCAIGFFVTFALCWVLIRAGRIAIWLHDKARGWA